MRIYLNEASIQGQFDDVQDFRKLIQELLAVRARSPILAAMRTTPALADRLVSHEYNVRQVVQSWRGSPVAAAFLSWVGRNGPFIEDDRLAEADDLFHCFGLDVTDGGLGEAARRVKANENAATMSFSGGDPDFARTPLPVVHGFEESPVATYEMNNFWTADAALEAALRFEEPATSWQGTVEAARLRFSNLLLPDALFREPRLVRDPFDAAIRDRIYALLGVLNTYASDRDDQGHEGAVAQEILRIHFHGDRANFSPESKTNQKDFREALTFPDPIGGQRIFAHWHGKISHRVYRIHFEWPIPSHSRQLKIVYIGPKLTKA
jgi:hypothetical protein